VISGNSNHTLPVTTQLEHMGTTVYEPPDLAVKKSKNRIKN
jgi:hypothetical protein